ncbi:MAG: 4'-phosphopantetheinyl transferase superfamily protein [Clostridia bacterium]|nr:4'-phosphopantetheinyl transferase superfamily protein [Clostridia bacterium]
MQMELNEIYVYTGRIPNSLKIESIYPKARFDEINACSNERAKREKYCAWKLLEYGITNALGISINEITFEKSENGKWLCSDFYFSISHSCDMVAAVISKSPVGIDIEKITEKLKRIMMRFLTEAEKKELESVSEKDALEYFCTKWTQKESIFKAYDKKAFTPSKIETSEYKTYVCKIENEYILSVYGESIENIHLFKNINYLN